MGELLRQMIAASPIIIPWLGVPCQRNLARPRPRKHAAYIKAWLLFLQTGLFPDKDFVI
jgi:hypothetical protein